MWHPSLRQSGKSLHDQLIDALARDIAAGTLPPGAQLPPQRDLAYKLKIGVGTVTKVYAEARRRGLLTATVGRGSFVAPPTAQPGADEREGVIDFSRNVSPATASPVQLAEALSALRHRRDLADHLTYAPPLGFDSHRQAGANWIADSAGVEVDWTRLVVCAGGQQAMALAFTAICKPGDTVLTESATFVGMKGLAEHLGLRIRGLKMDAEGLTPDALDRAAADGARVLYTIPTLQNPTGRMMSARRRSEIAAVARKRDITVVEDDVYGPFARHEGGPQALAHIMPERTFYVASLSKMVAPGLRCGYLVLPDWRPVDSVVRAVRALTYSPATFGTLVGTQWIEDGTAHKIAAAVKRDVAQRTAFATRLLGKRIEGPHAKVSPHIWLPMNELQAERIAGAALRGGVAVTPPSAPIVDATEISGLRLCIGAPRDMPTLERGLKLVADALAGASDSAGAVV